MDDCSKIVTLSANTSWYLYNFRQSTIKRLIGKGYRVVCISPFDEYSKELMDLGCEYYDLEMQNKGTNPFKDIKTFLKLLFIYLKLKPFAAFHFTVKNNIFGTWAGLISNTPSINNVSGLGTAFIRDGLISIVVRLLYKCSQPFAHRVYCQNPEDFDLLIDKKLVNKDKLFLLPGSGVDLKRFNSDSVKYSKNEQFTFLYVGRILADKGLFELIKAYKNLKIKKINCELWICGILNAENISSISKTQIEDWKDIPGIRWLDQEKYIENIYKQVDCVVLPSYREGMPKTLLEAGSMGLPSVATDVPGCRNIIQDNVNGFLCRAKDARDLEQAMTKALNLSKNEYEKMSINARNIVKNNFDEKIVIDSALNALDSILKNN
ncbi:glycosyltransferase family 4 protein [Gammaproteobacteria bacterium]|nr:glycosyltransferase family 4 protein [Gammaproteobacteria bacterium]|tara:strand:+ start:3528 stop:4661 length:1134 start_codon:yes stop_codon:yes gene_type:complete